MRYLTAASAVTVAACIAGLLASCREPTQITLELSTDLDCSSEVGDTAIYVGTAEELARPISELTPAAVTHGCPDVSRPENIGSIVILPSGSDDERVSLRVVTSVVKLPPPSCATDLRSGCVEARRSLGFVPHTPLRLPVRLSKTCENVVCDNAAETCVNGACVPGAVVCSGDCSVPGADGGSVDAHPIVDANPIIGKDTGLSDAPISTNTCAAAFPDAGAPTYVWHFDNQSLAEAGNHFQPPSLLPNASFVQGPINCSTALSPGGNEIVLGEAPQFVAPRFGVGLYVRTTAMNGPILSVREVPTGVKRWGLEVSGGNITALFCRVGDGGGSLCTSIDTSIGISNTGWHRVTLVSTITGVTLSVDGTVGGSLQIDAQNSVSVATLVALGLPGTAIDELDFFMGN